MLTKVQAAGSLRKSIRRYVPNSGKKPFGVKTLVKKYDCICIEDLRPSEMVRDKRLSKAISDANFGEIRRQLEYKSAWHQKQLIVADRWFPSSQTCSECGYENRAVRDLNVRYWKCPHCKAEHDRDVNAAVNILHEGIEKAGLSSIA